MRRAPGQSEGAILEDSQVPYQCNGIGTFPNLPVGRMLRNDAVQPL